MQKMEQTAVSPGLAPPPWDRSADWCLRRSREWIGLPWEGGPPKEGPR